MSWRQFRAPASPRRNPGSSEARGRRRRGTASPAIPGRNARGGSRPPDSSDTPSPTSVSCNIGNGRGGPGTSRMIDTSPRGLWTCHTTGTGFAGQLLWSHPSPLRSKLASKPRIGRLALKLIPNTGNNHRPSAVPASVQASTSSCLRRHTPARPLAVEHTFLSRVRRLVVASWVVAVSASILLVIREGLRHDPPRPRRLSAIVGSAGLLVLLMSAALTGHARGSALPVPNLMVALIHVTAAAAWVGGLVALVTVAFPSVRGMMETDRAALLAPVVGRFSDLAVWSVIAVVASGTYSAWMEIRGLDAVTASSYGWCSWPSWLRSYPFSRSAASTTDGRSRDW